MNRLSDLSFVDYSKSQDIHGIAPYPATMVGPVQKEILQTIIEDDHIETIMDPFYGSGTALYEAVEIDPDIRLVGCDINPLANLITRVKLEGVTKRIGDDVQLVESILGDGEIANSDLYKELDYSEFSKWFREDLFDAICLIRYAVKRVRSPRNRRFFWCLLTNIVKKYCNSRSSTFKLHIKTEDQIQRMQNRCVEDYRKLIEMWVQRLEKKAKSLTLYKEDTLARLPKMAPESIDLSITSPPYGDNATTVTYGQFSILSLRIIDPCDLKLEGWELETLTAIDKRSMGGHRPFLKDSTQQKIESYLQDISDYKQPKVVSFFEDYFLFMEQLCRITRKYIVLTLGNRTVDGKEINLAEITRSYLDDSDFSEVETTIRKIPRKRIPFATSRVKDQPVKSISEEHILIYRRNEGQNERKERHPRK